MANPQVVTNITNNLGETPFFKAMQTNRPSAVELLIEKHVDVNLANNEGTTPLMIAAANGSFDCVKLLLDKDKELRKMLIAAKLCGGEMQRCVPDDMMFVIFTFFQPRLNINQVRPAGPGREPATALSLAQQHGYHAIAQLLQDAI